MTNDENKPDWEHLSIMREILKKLEKFEERSSEDLSKGIKILIQEYLELERVWNDKRRK